MRTDMTSAQSVYHCLAVDYPNGAHRDIIMQRCHLDEIEFRCACTILIERGITPIFHDSTGRYYIPASEAEIREYGERHPQDLRFQLACFHRAKYGFHTN